MNGIQIRVEDLLYAVIKRWKMVLILMLMGCGFGVILSGISYVQGTYTNYKITCSVAVTSQTAGGSFIGNSGSFNQNDFYLAQDMVDAVDYLVKSDRVLDAAIQDAGLVSVGPKDVTRNLSLERYNETQIIEMTLKWNNADAGIRLMNAIVDSCKKTLPDTLMVGSVAVIDAPKASYTMGGGGYTNLWIIMSLLGLLIGLGVAILELIMKPTLLNLRDVENVFGLETLGVIPRDDAYFKDETELLDRVNEADSEVKQNFASTAYILRNHFGKSKKQHCFYITSAQDGEGKSTVAANLAVQLSDMEQRVLLIDLDTKSPSLGGMFLRNVDYDRTLNALYKGEANEQDAVISMTGYLDLLPAVLERNAIPFDGALFDFIRKIKQDYDYVIIDAPAVGQDSDVLSLNQIADMALFVIRFDGAAAQDIQASIDKLDKSGVRILGCVVNASQSIREFRRSGRSRAAEVLNRREGMMAAEEQDESATTDTLDEMTRTAGDAPESSVEGRTFGRNVLDELTDDLTESTGKLTDREAIQALIQMGVDGSWKKNAQEGAEEDEQSASDAPESRGE